MRFGPSHEHPCDDDQSSGNKDYGTDSHTVRLCWENQTDMAILLCRFCRGLGVHFFPHHLGFGASDFGLPSQLRSGNDECIFMRDQNSSLK